MLSIEVAKSVKTLICFLQSIAGNEAVVELRNDCFIKGKLVSVDSFMNVEFEKAKEWSIYANLDPNAEDGSEHLLTYELPNDTNKIIEHDYILIKGERIRFFHVDKRINMIENMRQQIDIYQNMRAKANAPRINWKIHRKRMRLEQLQQKLTESDQPESTQPSFSSSSSSSSFVVPSDSQNTEASYENPSTLENKRSRNEN